MKVLIVGGYGTFGARLARLLAHDARLTLAIAGRSLAKAEAFCAGLDAQAGLGPVVMDRDVDVAAVLAAEAPDIVVDAAGPFQLYGRDPYRLVRACIEAGANYLDLADSADFVVGIEAFDATAKARGVFVLSGLSTFPALSSAVVQALAGDLDRIEVVRAGVAPSPWAGIGPNVVRAISSYAGKPLSILRGGRRVGAPALIDDLSRTIAPPGGVPLRPIRFSLAETPDLALAERQWPGVREVWTGAGPTPGLLHRLLSCLAWLVRLKVVP
ncbi:MAG TPA: saccharopine dehydrogenase NADP-binding domain-containing protein, partial [Caulobacteraceae bacterium]|nr:saccharopine dehydrogenase NADP-binding domain-containing protein [Caulobacteraceae bacterium]